MKTIYYQHQYLKNGFDIGAEYTTDGKPYKAPKKHACLYFGQWCWSNALHNPKMALQYLWRRIRNG